MTRARFHSDASSIRRRRTRGQTVIEFAVVAPIFLFFMLAVSDIGYCLYQSHLTTALAREGSNLTARYGTLDEAETAMRSVASYPIAFDTGGLVILSVLKLGTAGANKNLPIIVQRHRFGLLAATSVLGDPAPAAYAASGEYFALDPDNDNRIRVAGALPNGLTLATGQYIHVTEVYSRRRPLARVGMLGLVLPTDLSARAYF